MGKCSAIVWEARAHVPDMNQANSQDKILVIRCQQLCSITDLLLGILILVVLDLTRKLSPRYKTSLLTKISSKLMHYKQSSLSGMLPFSIRNDAQLFTSPTINQ